MYAIKQNILPRVFFRPFRPRYQWANLRPGKFKKVLNNSLNKKDYLFFFVSGRIQNLAKQFASVEGRK